MIRAYLAWLWACVVWLAATIGYAIRPYDMLADLRRWRWQEPQRCGLPAGVRLVILDDSWPPRFVIDRP